MHPADRAAYVDRYRRRLRDFGPSPEALGWGRHGRQEVRFAKLAAMAIADPTSSVLDVGCGFADLYDFLTRSGWHGRYTGIDIVPDLLEVGRQRHPALDLRELDVTAAPDCLERHDYVIASGVFNAALAESDNLEHISTSLRAMSQMADVAVCVDFLSTGVDYQKSGAWHTDPAWALALAAKLNRRVALAADYMPFEFALFVYRDDSISHRNVFAAVEAEGGEGHAVVAPRQEMMSLIIPVYDEQESLPLLVDRLEQFRPTAGVDTEVIFVDDHSQDESPTLLRRACQETPGFRFLRLSRNCGSHVAILAGLEHARGSCAVFLAADLQDPPDVIPALLERWRGGSHVVWAVREGRSDVPRLERTLSRLFYLLVNRMSHVRLPPHGSDFALLDRKIIDALVASAGATPSLSGEIVRLGFRQDQVPYQKQPRQAGRSKWTIDKKLSAFADAIISFSYFPVRAMSYLGIASFFLGMLYASVLVVLRLTASHPIPGHSSLLVALVVFSGVQMAMLGILGEYLWRTFAEARRRPRAVVESSYGFMEERIADE